MITNNEERIKFINLGVKTFARCDNRNMECDFRLAQEGLPSVIGFLGPDRQLFIDKGDLIRLLSNNDPTRPPEISTLSEATQCSVQLLGPGSCVLQYHADDLQLDIVGWRGTKSLRAYVDQHDTVHMLRLLGADVSKYGALGTMLGMRHEILKLLYHLQRKTSSRQGRKRKRKGNR